jgi:F0F1-type ATP synthase assembly protein I
MKKETRSTMQNLALISQVGIMMIVPIFGCVWLGQLLDKKLGTGSLFLIVGIILGVGAAFRNLYQLAMKKSKEYDNKETPESYVHQFEKRQKEERKDKDNQSEYHLNESLKKKSNDHLDDK